MPQEQKVLDCELEMFEGLSGFQVQLIVARRRYRGPMLSNLLIFQENLEITDLFDSYSLITKGFNKHFVDFKILWA